MCVHVCVCVCVCVCVFVCVCVCVCVSVCVCVHMSAEATDSYQGCALCYCGSVATAVKPLSGTLLIPYTNTMF